MPGRFIGRGLVACALVIAGSLSATSMAQSSRFPAATSGSTKALVVFVRFKDDKHRGLGCRGDKGWPLAEGIEDLPAYAHVLFSDSDVPPFADSTVTEYFYRQSNGSLILYADVYPDVMVSDHDASYYRTNQGRGYGHLAAEIFDKMDPRIDFSEYDTNPRDGIVDQVFIILRRDEAGTFTGVAHLGGADQVRGQPRRELLFDGVRLDWASSGSFIYHERPGHVLTQEYLTRLIAHEYGHHIWNSRGFFAGHVPAITSNETPDTASATPSSVANVVTKSLTCRIASLMHAHFGL